MLLADLAARRRPHPGGRVRAGASTRSTPICSAPDDLTVIVGAFVPFLRELKKRGQRFLVLEKDPATLKESEMPFFRPAETAPEVIPQADVLLITGSTLLYHSDGRPAGNGAARHEGDARRPDRRDAPRRVPRPRRRHPRRGADYRARRRIPRPPRRGRRPATISSAASPRKSCCSAVPPKPRPPNSPDADTDRVFGPARHHRVRQHRARRAAIAAAAPRHQAAADLDHHRRGARARGRGGIRHRLHRARADPRELPRGAGREAPRGRFSAQRLGRRVEPRAHQSCARNRARFTSTPASSPGRAAIPTRACRPPPAPGNYVRCGKAPWPSAASLRTARPRSSPTAPIPGLVSHFRQAGPGRPCTRHKVPSDRDGMGASVDESLGVKVIHIAERDTQVAADAEGAAPSSSTPGRSTGFSARGRSPPSSGWGTHERAFPRPTATATTRGQPSGDLSDVRPGASTLASEAGRRSRRSLSRLADHPQRVDLDRRLPDGRPWRERALSPDLPLRLPPLRRRRLEPARARR